MPSIRGIDDCNLAGFDQVGFDLPSPCATVDQMSEYWYLV